MCCVNGKQFLFNYFDVILIHSGTSGILIMVVTHHSLGTTGLQLLKAVC